MKEKTNPECKECGHPKDSHTNNPIEMKPDSCCYFRCGCKEFKDENKP